jgi:RNA polymerase subunit RPABC4/transcription elongation factor Spt4
MKTKSDTGIWCGTCQGALESGWMFCPNCGKPSESGQRHNEELGVHDKIVHDRFICPGCGQKATAEGWNKFCPGCQAFVHFDCMVHHMFVPHTCPVCGSEIGD